MFVIVMVWHISIVLLMSAFITEFLIPRESDGCAEFTAYAEEKRKTEKWLRWVGHLALRRCTSCYCSRNDVVTELVKSNSRRAKFIAINDCAWPALSRARYINEKTPDTATATKKSARIAIVTTDRCPLV